jgi:hypothetical protein
VLQSSHEYQDTASSGLSLYEVSQPQEGAKMSIDHERYEQMADELAADLGRSGYSDTTNEPEFLLVKIAALKKQRELIDKQIDGIEQLV